MPFCIFCEKELTGKQEKFCSCHCKDQWWNQKRKDQVEGFKVVTSALEKAGFEVRRISDEGEK